MRVCVCVFVFFWFCRRRHCWQEEQAHSCFGECMFVFLGKRPNVSQDRKQPLASTSSCSKVAGGRGVRVLEANKLTQSAEIIRTQQENNRKQPLVSNSRSLEGEVCVSEANKLAKCRCRNHPKVPCLYITKTQTRAAQQESFHHGASRGGGPPPPPSKTKQCRAATPPAGRAAWPPQRDDIEETNCAIKLLSALDNFSFFGGKLQKLRLLTVPSVHGTRFRWQNARCDRHISGRSSRFWLLSAPKGMKRCPGQLSFPAPKVAKTTTFDGPGCPGGVNLTAGGAIGQSHLGEGE